MALALLLAGFLFLLPNFASAESLRECLNSLPSEVIGEISKIGADSQAEGQSSGAEPSSAVGLASANSPDFYFPLTLRNWGAWQIRNGFAAILATCFGSHSATSPPAHA